ncbi:MAG TPA: capsular polysaccharide synthesis protein [Burkholderiaceae bacterium]
MQHNIPAPALRLAYRLLTLFKPRSATNYNASPQTASFTGTDATQPTPPALAATIPPLIWSYWNGQAPDPLVRQCIANWRLHCPTFEVRVLNAGTVGNFVAPGDLPHNFATLHPTKQSDWIRLYVIHKFGGYWLDATILLTQPLDWLDAWRQTQQAEFVGFYLDGYTQDARYPVVESWAFGAPPGTPFIAAWQREFHHALIEADTDAYLATLRQQADGADILQGIADPAYLLIHVAAQRVLRRPNRFTLALFRAEDTAFFYQRALWWKWYLLYPRLCLLPAEPSPAPLIKLRGGERRHFAALFAEHGAPAPGSIWQRANAPA